MKRLLLGLAGLIAIATLSLYSQVSIDRTDTFSTVKQRLGAAYLSATNTVDPASIADGAVTFANVTVTGAVVGNYALASHSAVGTANCIVSANVSAPDTVRVIFFNKNGAPLDIASGALRVTVFK